MKDEIKTRNCESENAHSKKQKFEIATAKRRNRNHFSILRFNLFRFSALAYSRLYLRKQEDGRVVKALDITIRMSTPLWVRSSCVSRFQGTFPSSGFHRFSSLEYQAPPPTRLVTLREPHICKTVVHFAVGKLAFKFTIPSHSRCEFDLRLG